MRFSTPEIAWHNRDPVYSVDIQPVNQVDPLTSDVWYRLATSGTDAQIVLWQVFQRKPHDSFKQPKIEVLSQLTRHEKAVNVVRFTPTGEDTLASADVDGIIIIWKKGEIDRFTADLEQSEQKASVKPVSPPQQIKESDPDVMIFKEDGEEEEDIPVIANFEEEIVKIENWNQWKVLRGHLEDVVDISWSSDGLYLLSASVDNESIVWDVNKGCKTHLLSGHKSWVQGVAWDPLNEYLATISADRCLRVFSTSTKKNIFKIEKGSVMHEGKLTKTRLFYDYTLSSFTRRLSFSPGGEFLLVPSGVLEFPKPSDLTSSPARKSEKVVNNNCPVNTAPVEEDVIDRSPSGSTKENDVSINNNVDSVEVERMEVETEKDNLDKDDNIHLPDNKSNEEEPMNEDDAGDEGADGEDADDEDFDDDDEMEVTAVKLEKPPPEEPELNYINACHLFLRNNVSKPLAYLPTGEKFCHAVRFCPTRFQLIQCENSSRASSQENSEVDEEETDLNPFPFAYRLVFAVATQNAVILYDSQHMAPFAYITDIHYTRISDIAWSRDGRLLMISSTDGFCTFVTFAEGELGVEYEGEAYVFPVAPESPAKNEENVDVPFAEGSQSSKDSDKVKGTVVSNGSAPATPEVIIKTPSVGKFFTKVSREERLETMKKELSMLDTTRKRVVKKIPDASSSTPEVVILNDSESESLESKQLLDKTINDVAEGKLSDGQETTPAENATSNPSSQTSCVDLKTSPIHKNPFVLSVRRASKSTGNSGTAVKDENIQASQTHQQQELNGQEDENRNGLLQGNHLTDAASESSDRMEVIDTVVSQATDSIGDGDIPSAPTSTEEVKKPRRVNFVTLIKAKKPA